MQEERNIIKIDDTGVQIERTRTNYRLADMSRIEINHIITHHELCYQTIPCSTVTDRPIATKLARKGR